MEIEFNLPSDEAFSHLFLVGLASIIEDSQPDRTCWITWQDRAHAGIKTSDDLTLHDYAVLIHAHSKRWNTSSWLSAESEYFSGNKKRGHSTLSPRVAAPDSKSDWEALQYDRETAIDVLETVLDHRYIGALGEPSYWSGRLTDKAYTPDRGASRWEMVTRNKGQEFISGRLVPLTTAVAKRSIEQIEGALRGSIVIDEVGRNALDSRTPTGFRLPSTTDNVLALCALVGVSAFMVGRSTKPLLGGTAGFFQLKKPTPRVVLPLWSGWWTLAKYRTVVRSAALTRYGVALANRNVDNMSQLALIEKGCTGVFLFEQYMSGNSSAPERWLKKGVLTNFVQ